MNKAFTLIELSIVVTVIAILLSITTVGLTTLQNHSYVQSTVETIISDMKHQQLKSMSGNTDGETTHESYGIYFESDRYTLFRGSVYDPNDPLNFSIVLNDSLEFTNILFPSSLLIFAKGSGEVTAYTSNNDSITLYNNATEETQTIILNRYGVITNIN